MDTHIPAGSVVEYNKVLVNLGDGFDINTGSFTAPVHGIYFFTINFMTNVPKQSNLAIYAKDERLCVTYAVQPYGAATCSAMTELNIGDVVNVRGIQTNVGAYLYQSDWVYKNHHSFVGFLYKSL